MRLLGNAGRGCGADSLSQRFDTIELGALRYTEASEKGMSYLGASAYVARFLEFFLQEENFSRLARLDVHSVIVPLMRRKTRAPCRVVSSLTVALRSKADLQRACLRGLEVFFVLRRPTSLALHFCLTAEYVVTNRRTLGSGQPGDPLQLFSDPSRLMDCLGSLEVKPGECVSVFAHDGDPVYLIERQAG